MVQAGGEASSITEEWNVRYSWLPCMEKIRGPWSQDPTWIVLVMLGFWLGFICGVFTVAMQSLLLYSSGYHVSFTEIMNCTQSTLILELMEKRQVKSRMQDNNEQRPAIASTVLT